MLGFLYSMGATICIFSLRERETHCFISVCKSGIIRRGGCAALAGDGGSDYQSSFCSFLGIFSQVQWKVQFISKIFLDFRFFI